MKFKYNGRIVAARNKVEACRKIAASARKVTASARFMEGLVDYMEGDSSAKANLVSETMSDTAGWAPSSDWEIREYSGDKIVYEIKYKGSRSALDNVKLEGVEAWEITNSENEAFLDVLADEVSEEFGLDLYQYGRSGGWLGFDLASFADKYIKVSVKDDAGTRKEIADEIRRLYGDDDTQFSGNESVEELVSMLGIDDCSEGRYVGDGNEGWFKVDLTDEGFRALKYIEDTIKSQCDYMMTEEWLEGVVDSWRLEKGEDGVYRRD